MRYFIVTLLFWGLTSCNGEQINELEYEVESLQSEVDDLRYELEEAQQKISNLEDRSNALDSELSSLESEINDFQWQDWQSNVYDVEWKFRNVISAFEELRAEF